MEELSEGFVGSGWKFPVEFKKSLKTVEMYHGEDDIRNSLDILFATNVGERIMHSSYGTALSTFLFTPVNRSILTYMEAIVTDEVLFNEPRIVLTNIHIEPSVSDPGTLYINLEYKVSATNNRYNYVFPFYLKEATNLER
jgi:hypothetical protein